MNRLSITLVAVTLFILVNGASAALATWNWNKAGSTGWDWNDPANWLPNTSFPTGTEAIAIIQQNATGTRPPIRLNQAITLNTLDLTDTSWSAGWELAAGTGGSLTMQALSGEATLRCQSRMTGEIISAPVNLASDTRFFVNNIFETNIGDLSNPGYYLKMTGVVSGNKITKEGAGLLWLVNTGNTFTGALGVRQGYLMAADWQGALGDAANTVTLGGRGTIGHLASGNSSATLTRNITLTEAGGGLHAGNNFNLDNIISGNGDLWLGMGSGTINFNNTGSNNNSYVGDTYSFGRYVRVNTALNVFKGDLHVKYMSRVWLQSASNLDADATVRLTNIPTGNSYSSMPFVAVKSDFVPTFSSDSNGLLLLATHSGANIQAALAVGSTQIGDQMMLGATEAERYFKGASLRASSDRIYRFAGDNWLYLDQDQNYWTAGVGVLSNQGDEVNNYSVEVRALPFAWGLSSFVACPEANDFKGSLTIYPNSGFAGWAVPAGVGSQSPLGASTGAININGGALWLYERNGGQPMVKDSLNYQGFAHLRFQAGTYVTSLTVNNLNRVGRSIIGIEPQQNKLGDKEKFIVTTDPAGKLSPVNGMVAPYMVNCYGDSFLSYDPTNGFIKAVPSKVDDLATAGATDIVDLNTGGTLDMAGESKTVYALRLGSTGTGASYSPLTLTNGTIIVNSGGVIFDGSSNAGWNGTTGPLNHTANFVFPSGVEGVFYVSGQHQVSWWAKAVRISGTITSDTGFTLGSPLYGNGTAQLVLSGDNSTTLSGQITINQGRLIFTRAAALGTATIYLNGGLGGDGNTVFGSLVNGYNGDTNTILNNPIILGPNGGSIEAPYINGYPSTTLAGTVTGPGALCVGGHQGTQVILTNPANSYEGGTWITTGRITVNGGNLGTGNVTIGYGGAALHLYTANALSPTAKVTLMARDSADGGSRFGLYVSTEIGSLEGNGNVMFYNTSTLTMGGNNQSTEFFGNLSDYKYIGWENKPGSLVKTGSGIFTLWGEGFYGGTTTINAGTFTVQGLLSGFTTNAVWGLPAAVTVNGGTLNGKGTIGREVIVNPDGTLSGNLNITRSVNSSGTVNGDLEIGSDLINSGTASGMFTIGGILDSWGGTVNLNVGSTVAGGLWLEGGTLTGSGTINGFVWLDGGTFSGSHTVVAGEFTSIATVTGTHTITVPLLQISGGSFGGNSTVNGNVALNGGTMSGTHTINGNLTSGTAVIAPGSSAGTITVVGDVSLGEGTLLNYDLGAPGAGGTDNDLIEIDGDLILDGTVNVAGSTSFANGDYRLFNFTGTLTDGGLAIGAKPDLTKVYSIVTGATFVDLHVEAAFAADDTNHDLVVDTLDIDYIYDVINARVAYDAACDVNTDSVVDQADVTFWLTSPLVGEAFGHHSGYGDTNLDHKINFADFQVVLDHWQASGSAWATGDFTGDEVVNFSDFQKLLDNWNPSGLEGAAVPEPATLVLLGLGAVGLIRRRK